MEKPPVNHREHEAHDRSPAEVLGEQFNTQDQLDFTRELRLRKRANPTEQVAIIANWVSAPKARFAKGLWDERHKYNLTSITIRATRAQYMEDVNAFQSGVKWEEV